MADNTTLNSGSGGDVIASDDISGVKYQRVKIVQGADGANDGDVSSSAPLQVTLANTGANATAVKVDGSAVAQPVTDNSGSLTVDASTAAPLPQIGYFATCSTDVTRPADTTQYAAGDALSNSTSAPTSGGFTFTGAARASGKSGIITDAIITTSADAGTLLQGDIFVFNQAVTNINDNAAFAVTDAEIKTCVGKIPFTLEDVGNNGFAHITNLSIGFTCVGSADLRFLVRVRNTYTPASAEVLTFVIKCIQVD